MAPASTRTLSLWIKGMVIRPVFGQVACHRGVAFPIIQTRFSDRFSQGCERGGGCLLELRSAEAAKIPHVASKLLLPRLFVNLAEREDKLAMRRLMKNYEFTIIIEKDEDGRYLAICPGLQGCYTEGETEEDAKELIRDAIRLHIESRKARNEPIYEEVGSEKIRLAV